jgi:hypothetical protein
VSARLPLDEFAVRRDDRLPVHAEAFAESTRGGKAKVSIEIAPEDRRPERGGDLEVDRPLRLV